MALTRERRTTRTDLPQVGTGRQRTAFSNTHECARRWASHVLTDGRAGNVYFRNGVIYSYGEHFPIARWVRLRDGRRVVFFTTRTYSSSTAGHCSAVRSAIPHGVPVFHVDNVMADTGREHRDNLRAKAREARQLFNKAGRARVHRGWLLEKVRSVIREANEYAAAVGLKSRLGEPEGLGEWIKEAEKAEEGARRKAVRKAVAAWERDLAEWQAGEKEHVGPCPDAQDPRHGLAYLRVKGKVIETTLRAAVPVKAAVPLLAVVRGERDLPAGFILDGYKVQAIDRAGRVLTVGCHRVTFDEVERVAALLKL